MNNEKRTTLPRSGKEFNKVYTSILIPFIALILLKGLMILMVLIADILVILMDKDSILEITTKKSMIFQPSRR